VGSAASEEERANGRSALTGRTHRVARENGRERERIGADMPVPPGSGREREGERVRTACLGWIQPNGLNLVFQFPWNF
jgi:hypothetical protein